MATNKGAELLESLKTQGLSQQEMLNRLDAIVDAESARKVAVLHKEQRARNAYRKSNRHADNQENDKRDENNQHDPYHLNF